MNKLIKSSIAVTAFVSICNITIAQTDSTATPTEAPAPVETPAPDPNAVPVDPNAVPSDVSATPMLTDSTGAPIGGEAAPAATSAGSEKPATRNKLYSGKHRGNNVIYDPKK